MASGDEARRGFAKRLMGPLICVHLAATGESFYLNQQHLQGKSGYFRSLCSSGLREVTDNKVTLQLAVGARQAFHAVVEYLYTDEYEPYGQSPADECIESAYVYVLADRFLISELKTMALDSLRHGFGQETSGTPPGFHFGALGSSTSRKKTKRIRAAAELGSWDHREFDATQTNRAPRSSLLSPETIQLVKGILYDEMVDLVDITIPDNHHDSFNAEAPGQDTVPFRADDLSSTETDAATDANTSKPTAYVDPRRDGQLAFSRYLSSHLPSLRESPGFKNLLADGFLDGQFMVDFLCPSI